MVSCAGGGGALPLTAAAFPVRLLLAATVVTLWAYPLAAQTAGTRKNAGSKYFSRTEDEVKWYRNPRDLDIYENYFTLPPTGVLMPPVEPNQEEMPKVELEGGMGRCTDGSNPVYYLAYGPSSTKWVIFLEGGDWCTRYDNIGDKDGRRNCVERRDKTGLQGGTTREDPEALRIHSLGDDYGQLDGNPDRNPLMHDWNKVYIRNCDGSSFTSAREDVKRVDGEVVYFRGKFILDEVMADLIQTKHLGFATDVVIAGCSAGGLAVYLHADMMAEAISAKARALGRADAGDIRVVALADSGFFLHHAGGLEDCNFVQRMQFMYREMNVTSGLQPACVAAFDTPNQYKCLFAETAIHFSKTPLFTMQSIQDGWQLKWIACNGAGDEDKRNWYGDEMWGALDLATRNPKNGGFIDACQHHCHCYENIYVDGDNQAQAFLKFYNQEGQRVWSTRTCNTELKGECPLKTG
mmetsp:Transcript_16961/g.47349  ORF Transcript_16961/g.47349 Transcript_16961/m.47349 type:complete len:464 (+) Transcript_16961:322-1713(+)|eukprot:CAMPEP_0117665466 /NCGR_PEP_ID=MMETSP0804-20121206/9826_1 /TAXON_ID=1074897 /ORGANISM="Tetraselmis astigmatica, Strain CCMP880" /LENGTH=463 /DNA_ID=CAMNT_0005472883 /DNA_START=261 /DNA_END=1652 /DNA_ORIENTATION=+